MIRACFIGLIVLFHTNCLQAQTLVELNLLPPTLPKELPWWGPKSKENQLSWDDLQGKVVLVHFWNSEDEQGKSNFQSFQEWKKSFSKRGFELLGMHIRNHDDNWDQEAIQKEAIKQIPIFTSILDREGVTRDAWKIESIPTLYLIDRKGIIRYRFDGFIQWKEKDLSKEVTKAIEKLIAEDPKK